MSGARCHDNNALGALGPHRTLKLAREMRSQVGVALEIPRAPASGQPRAFSRDRRDQVSPPDQAWLDGEGGGLEIVPVLAGRPT